MWDIFIQYQRVNGWSGLVHTEICMNESAIRSWGGKFLEKPGSERVDPPDFCVVLFATK